MILNGTTVFSVNQKQIESEAREIAPEPPFPQKPQPLFVIKPIKNHEPYSMHLSDAKFAPDPKMIFKELRSIPKDHEEARQISEKLAGEKLMKIQVGPTTMAFGRVFVKSTNSLYF